MDFDNRQYMILAVSELSAIDFSQVLETSADTVQKSVDGLKTFVKWDGTMPSCVADLTTSEGPYTYEEMLEILATEQWTEPFNLQ